MNKKVLSNNKSIISIVRKLFSAILIWFTVFLIVQVSITNRSNRVSKQIIISNSSCSQLYNDLFILKQYTTNYLSQGEDDLFLNFEDLTQKLDDDIKQAKKVINQTDLLLGTLRRIEDYNDYQRNLSLNNFDYKKNIHETIKYINTSLEAQMKEIEWLVSENLRINELKLQDLTKNEYYIHAISWILSVIVLLLIVVPFIKFQRELFNTLSIIRNYTNELTKHNWGYKDIQESSFNEINKAINSMNLMKHEIVRYVSELKEKTKLEREIAEQKIAAEYQEKSLIQAQLTALRSQINPHFLFNALNMVGKSAILDEAELSMEIIEAISKILRYSLEADNNLVSLKQELDIVDSYLFLQKIRFQDSIIINKEVEKETLDLKLPPMIIQILVENCFKHAFNNNSILEIKLSTIKLENDLLKITIEDNGPGFDASKINIKGHGLNNVRERLRLRYNQENLLIIKSSENLGYSFITLLIPQKD